MPDLRGAGGSAKPATGYDKKTMAADIHDLTLYGDVPLALVKGRERTCLEHFWNDFAADPKRSVPAADRRLYARATRSPAPCGPASSTSAISAPA